MAYRKIVVDGVTHKYVVGRTHVKIHGGAAVPIHLIGAQVSGDRWAVSPLRVATYIKLGHVPENTPAPNILLAQSSAAMRKLITKAHEEGDYAQPHRQADQLLCDVLRELGYGDLVNTFHQVPKWYA